MPLSDEDMKAVLFEVQTNHYLLDRCYGPHVFQVIVTPLPTPHPRYVCRLCGGEVDAVALYWYRQGFSHGIRL